MNGICMKLRTVACYSAVDALNTLINTVSFQNATLL